MPFDNFGSYYPPNHLGNTRRILCSREYSIRIIELSTTARETRTYEARRA